VQDGSEVTNNGQEKKEKKKEKKKEGPKRTHVVLTSSGSQIGT
jgi:hypothetical protein